MSEHQELTDRESLRDLLARNAAWLDGAGYEAADIFSESVALRGGPHGDLVGRDAVAARIGPNPERGYSFQHVYSDVIITLTGDTARVEANALVHAFRPGEAPYNVRGLRAWYDAAREEGGWLFTGAGITPLWQNGTPLT